MDLSRVEKEIKAIKDRILKDINNLFENEKEEVNHFKPVRVNNLWSNNYIEYESNGDRIEHFQLKSILIKLAHI